MKLRSVLFLAAIILVAGDGKNEVRKEPDGLLGDWKLVSLGMEGEKVPLAEQAKEEKNGDFIQAAITKDKITLSYVLNGNRNTETLSYKLDTTKNPKWIDLIQPGQTIEGIYSVEKNTLRVCLTVDGKGRPNEFASAKDSHSVLAVFEREKKR